MDQDFNYTSYNIRTQSLVYAIKSGNICGGFERLDEAVKNINGMNNEISLYPNPAHDKLNITSTGIIREVTIGDLLGQVLFNRTYDQDKLEVDISGLPVGVYYVKVNRGDVRKFVKE